MNKENEEFEFFWGGPFSQWHMCEFTVNGVVYNCAEQYMMQQKALLFSDYETAKEIMESETPKDQKAFGRKVKDFDSERWFEHAQDIVYAGNFAKFNQNPDLKLELLATDKKTLVEASPYDKIWGIGLKRGDPKCANRDTWQGTNYLGEIVTKVRNDLK